MIRTNTLVYRLEYAHVLIKFHCYIFNFTLKKRFVDILRLKLLLRWKLYYLYKIYIYKGQINYF